MTEAILGLLTGVAVGALFAVVRVPIPAPPTLAGLLGIVGIVGGYQAVLAVKELL